MRAGPFAFEARPSPLSAAALTYAIHTRSVYPFEHVVEPMRVVHARTNITLGYLFDWRAPRAGGGGADARPMWEEPAVCAFRFGVCRVGPIGLTPCPHLRRGLGSTRPPRPTSAPGLPLLSLQLRCAL